MLASRLADERQRLDELSAGDLAVRSSISMSYRALDEPARKALGRMCFFGLPTYCPVITSYLLESSPAEAERVLESLVDAQLVAFAGVDMVGVLRYRVHDLVRLYACEQAEAAEPFDELVGTVSRALAAWLAIMSRIIASSPPAEAVWKPESAPALELPDNLVNQVLADTSAWLQGEEPTLAVAVERAAALGLSQLVCDLVSAHTAVELAANRFDFRDRVINAGLAAAQRAGDPQSEAAMLTELAQLRFAQDRFADSRRYFAEALSRFRALQDVRGQAASLVGMGVACREPGYLAEAIHFLDQAAALLQALDDPRGMGYALRIRGSVRVEQGDYAAARSDLDASLAAYQRIDSRRGVALTLRTLGIYHRARGEFEAAVDACAQAAEIFAALGDELMHSYAVRALAKTQLRMGHGAEALPRLESALATASDADDRFGQAATLHVLGQLHLAEARLDLAGSCFDAAMSMWKNMETPLWRARTEYAMSLLHRQRGELEAADAALASARKVFHEHGAREFTELGRTAATAADLLKRS